MTIPQSAGVPSPAPPGTTWSSAISSPAHTCGPASTTSANPPRGTHRLRRRGLLAVAEELVLRHRRHRRLPEGHLLLLSEPVERRRAHAAHPPRMERERRRQAPATTCRSSSTPTRPRSSCTSHRRQYRKATDRREVLHQEDHRGRIHLSGLRGLRQDLYIQFCYCS